MLNGDSIADMVYLDFAKAFDKVGHGILLHKVKDLGITGKLGQWFYHFLTNRKHFVRLPAAWGSPHKISQITQLEKVQRSFTKHIAGLRDLSYHERLQTLKLYSLQRRRKRYCIILIWKIIENKSQNLSDPILCKFSDRRGRSCVISHVDMRRLGTLAYNSFRWRTI